MIEFVSVAGRKYTVKKSAFIGYSEYDDITVIVYFTFGNVYMTIKEFERIKGELK